MSGQAPQKITRNAEILENLVGRLTAPDLTVSDSQKLRPTLFLFLDGIEAGRHESPSDLAHLDPAPKPASCGAELL
ncbi:MAG: hypothetical protein NVSMB9_20240 [Isosphaeraceae bacterium]